MVGDYHPIEGMQPVPPIRGASGENKVFLAVKTGLADPTLRQPLSFAALPLSGILDSSPPSASLTVRRDGSSPLRIERHVPALAGHRGSSSSRRHKRHDLPFLHQRY